MTQQDVYTKFDQFLRDNNGKYISVLNPGKQCFDLAVAWTDILGVPHFPNNPSPFPYVNACDIYNQYLVFQAQYFDRIANSDTFIPQKGDIGVWDAKLNGGFGHVAVCTGVGDTKTFQSFDQNWVLGSVAQLVTHNYNYFLGVLRFKVTQPPMTLPQELQQYSLAWKDLCIKNGLDVNAPEFKPYQEIDLQISIQIKNATDPLTKQIVALQGTNKLLKSQIDSNIENDKALNTEIEDLTQKLSDLEVQVKADVIQITGLQDSLKVNDTTLAECQKQCQDLKKQLAQKPIEKVYKTKLGKQFIKLANYFG